MKRFLMVFLALGLTAGSVTTAEAKRVELVRLGSHLAQSDTDAPILTKLTASDGGASDLFGIMVAVSGDTAVVGAPHKAGSVSPMQGAAYVFTRSGGTWTEQAKLVPSDGGAGDRFGQAVAISGDTIVVGSFWHNVGVNPDQGAAYVFTRSEGTWTEQAKLTASDGRVGDQFGFSVAVSGDTALVGAATQSTISENPNQGAAYVFTRAGGTWAEQAKLTASDASEEDHFGERVALSGDTALVGAPGDNIGGNTGQGSAYVFARTGGSWTEQAKLTASDGTAEDAFGFWVAVSGDTAAVGAMNDDAGAGAKQGSAYVFTRAAQGWVEQAKLTASDGAAGDAFARSVALSGDKVVVGAQSDDVDGQEGQGSAYVFTRNEGKWSEQSKLVAPDGAATDTFGASVGVSGDTVIVGAGFHDGDNADQGAAYVWEEDSAPPTITEVADGPDPFTPTADTRRFTTISYSLSENASVSLKIFDRRGRPVRTLLKGDPATTGRHSVRWNGRNDGRRVVPAGKYQYRIKAVDAAGNQGAVAKGTVVVRR